MPQLPSNAYAEYTLKSHQPTLYNAASNGKSLNRHVNGHITSFNISFPVLTASQFAELDGFLTDVSTYKSFTITLPDREPQGVATGTPLVNGAAAKGDTSINVDGLTVATTDILKAGDILKFSGHTHVYTNISDVDSGAADNLTLEDGTGVLLLETGDDLLLESSGQATLSIQPPLKESVSDGEALTLTSVPFTVVCTNDHSSNVQAPILYNFSFEAKEVS